MGLDNAYGVGSLKPGVCTSTSRPAAPFEGQLIYETDTDLVRSWNGSSWVTIGPTAASPVTAVGYAQVLTLQTTSSTSYTDLSTTGPSVTLTTGTTAIVMASSWYFDTNNDGCDGYISVAVSGSSTVSASDNWSGYGRQDQNHDTPVLFYQFTGLTAGSNTFTMKYKKAGGSTTAGFQNRFLTVLAG